MCRISAASRKSNYFSRFLEKAPFGGKNAFGWEKSRLKQVNMPGCFFRDPKTYRAPSATTSLAGLSFWHFSALAVMPKVARRGTKEGVGKARVHSRPKKCQNIGGLGVQLFHFNKGLSHTQNPLDQLLSDFRKRLWTALLFMR